MTNGKQDELDRALDAALAKYAAEPRAGLEQRVLANLRAETARGAERAWWRWSVLAVVAAVLLIAVGLAKRLGNRTHPTTHVAVTAPTTEPAGTKVATSGEQHEVRVRPGRAVRRAAQNLRSDAIVTAAAQPKLDQFPSPQPLSEQERALARYVSQFPREAEVIARAQAEYEKEIQELMKNANGRTEGNDSDEKER
jgi:hypothetical protein